MNRFCLLVLLLLASTAQASAGENGDFVWPGHGVPQERPVWGHRHGLRIGLAPAPGPHGLIRLYAPYLGQEYPRMVNYLSVEPTVKGQAGRDQSELERSRDRPGERGLTFRPSNYLEKAAPSDNLPSGLSTPSAGTLRLFVHSEPFPSGAQPVLEITFHRDHPYEIEIAIHANPDSAPMESCVISATMGNYGLLRRLHLAGGRIEQAPELWSDEQLDALGFLPWRTWSAENLERLPDGRVQVRASSNFPDPSHSSYGPDVPPHWRYRGDHAIHYWRAESSTRPSVAVNARRSYWQTGTLIPGGASFENFELRMPFDDGQRLWFGIVPLDDDNP